MLHSNTSKQSNKSVRELGISNPTPIFGQEPTTVFYNRERVASQIVTDNTATPTQSVRYSYPSATLEPLYSSEKPLPVPPEQSCSSEPAERDLSSRVSSNVDVWGKNNRDTPDHDGHAVPDNKRNEDQAQPKTEPYDESFRYSRSIYNPISFASLDFGVGRSLFDAVGKNPFCDEPTSNTQRKRNNSQTFEEISLDSEPPEETEPEDDMAGRKTVKISLFLSSFAILVSAIALIFFGLIFEKYKSLERVLGKSIVVDAPSITPVTSPTVPPPPVQETAINPEPADDPTSVILLAPIRKTSELEMSDAVTSSFTSSSTLSPTTSSLSSSETDAPSSSIASILLQPSDTEFLLRRSGVEPHLAFPTKFSNRLDHIAAHKSRRHSHHVQERQAGHESYGEGDSTATSTSTTTTTTTVTRTIPTGSSVVTSSLETGEDLASQMSPTADSPVLPWTSLVAYYDSSTQDATESSSSSLIVSSGYVMSSDSPESITLSQKADIAAFPTTTSATHHSLRLSNSTATILPTSSSAAARRLVAPISWKSLTRNAIPRRGVSWWSEAFSRPIATHQKDNNEVLLPTATTASGGVTTTPQPKMKNNAILRRQTPQSPFSNQTASERNITPWEAYSQLRLQLIQLCFDVETYQNNSPTREEDQTAENLAMGEKLNEQVCDSLDAEFPAVDQGAVECDNVDDWRALEDKVGGVCGLNGVDEKLMQGVGLVSGVLDTLSGNLQECGEAGEGGSMDESVRGGRVTSGSGAAPSATGRVAGTDGISISLQQNTVVDISLDSGVVDSFSCCDFWLGLMGFIGGVMGV